MVNRERIAETARLIAPYVRRTPVVAEGDLVFKLELLQHSGSFKVRGAFTNLLTREVPKAGIVAASGGNHGVAVSYAAQQLVKPARIYVPTVCSPAKIERIRSYGAHLVIGGDLYADALAASEKWAAESGAMQIHAFDQEGALLGQGTVGMEFEEQAKLDTLFVAVGGGGLIGGIAAWFERRIKVIGVEPVLAPTLTKALEAGKPVDAPAGGIAADSLAPKQVGKLMFPLAQKYVEKVILVEDDEIQNAQKELWERFRLVTEAGAAAAYAGLKRYRPQKNEKVGVLLCGANTTAVKF